MLFIKVIHILNFEGSFDDELDLVCKSKNQKSLVYLKQLGRK